MYESEEAGIDENWYLLDNQLTCNAFINGKYPSNIIDAPDGKYINFHRNSGVVNTNKIGNLPIYPNHVWYNPKELANILSLGLMQNHHLVTYNSIDGYKFAVHMP